jgi:tricorn protease-like protein
MGRINVKTKQIDYMVPRDCEEFLENCNNVEFSISGNKFLYEIVSEKENKKITALYLGDFEKKEFLEVLTTDEVGDRLWVDDGEKFFYTEQEEDKRGTITETIHLVDIKNQTDDVLYSGSYISQLTFDAGGRYLYFLEKHKEGENFDLMKLDLKNKKTEIILTDNYNKILLVR